MRTAHGTILPSLQYDKILAQQFYAKSREVKPKSKKYSIAIDLRPLWLLIQEVASALRKMDDKARSKLKMLIKVSLFLNRHDRVSRAPPLRSYLVKNAAVCTTLD